MAPLVLDKEETVDDDEDHGESDDDHHQEAAVKEPAEKTGLVTSLGDADHYNYNGCFIIIIIIIIFVFLYFYFYFPDAHYSRLLSLLMLSIRGWLESK